MCHADGRHVEVLGREQQRPARGWDHHRPHHPPVKVSRITTATSIALGYYHSCALLTDGKVKCWGRNDYGGLGDGTTNSSSIPVEWWASQMRRTSLWVTTTRAPC